MYSIMENSIIDWKLVDKEQVDNLTGFMMSSANKVFMIQGCGVKKIQVIDKKLAHPLVSRKVMKKYEKLIAYLTELLIDDDDSGESFREALNQIEKFRLEIKNKYRAFLKQKELEMMSKQLIALQKEANKRLIEIHNSYVEMMSSKRGSK